MSQITRTFGIAVATLAVLLGSMAIERHGGRAAATTIRPDKEQVRRALVLPGTMTDPCVAPAGPGTKAARPTAC
jgi:hypothetical protein